MTSEAPRAATQVQPDPEPLFQSGGSQSVRLTQEEVLEMAGLNFEDMDLAMDDADLDEEAGGGDNGDGGEAGNNEVPSGWDEISFDIPAENMSTQRQQQAEQAEQAAQAAQVDVPEAVDHPGGVDAPSEQTGSAAQGQFEPDDDIFGNDSAQNIKAEPVEEEEEEELEPDELDPTQDSSGRQVSIETAGGEHLMTDACRSSHRSSPTKRPFMTINNCTTIRQARLACMFITGDMLVPSCLRVCPFLTAKDRPASDRL